MMTVELDGGGAASKHPIPAVGAVILDQDRLLLIRRARPPAQGMWAVPGGKVMKGETLVGALTREVLEETGLMVEVGEVVWVGETASESDRHFVLIDFYATVIGGTLSAGDDASDARWVSLDDAKALSMPPTMYRLLEVIDVR